MKLALQLTLIPGDGSTLDKVKWAKDHGVEGIEVICGSLDKMRREADEINGLLPITSVCGNATVGSDWHFHFLDPDVTLRRASIEGSKALLEFCGQVGAVGQIVPPIFGPPVVPDLTPVLTQLELEDKLMVAALQELGPVAVANKTLFLLEPLNGDEQHYLRKQSDGIRVIELAGVEGIALTSDLFHMDIEETSIPQALREAGKHVAHVHLADNTRFEPGTGDIDFVAAFKALKAIDYSGYMAYECEITGETDAEKIANFAKSLEFIRHAIAQA
jgi:sugar phosphate isomerase/epimerase